MIGRLYTWRAVNIDKQERYKYKEAFVINESHIIQERRRRLRSSWKGGKHNESKVRKSGMSQPRYGKSIVRGNHNSTRCTRCSRGHLILLPTSHKMCVWSHSHQVLRILNRWKYAKNQPHQTKRNIGMTWKVDHLKTSMVIPRSRRISSTMDWRFRAHHSSTHEPPKEERPICMGQQMQNRVTNAQTAHYQQSCTLAA